MAALALVVVANIAYEFAEVFYNAFLADVAPPERIGRVSGYGWGLGYLGGLLALVLALVLFVQPEVPFFGFSTEAGENVRATNLLVAGWYLLFSIPMFLWVEGRVGDACQLSGGVPGRHRIGSERRKHSGPARRTPWKAL